MSSRSFILSLLFHAAGIAALLWGGAVLTPPSRPVLDTVIEPNKEKLVWYHFKAELPNIDSPTANKDNTRGVKRSPRVVIADSRNGHPTQFVWQPSPAELPKEVKAPNLISLHSSSPERPAPIPPSPVVPDIPKPRKAYVPPPVAPVVKAAPVVIAMAPAPVLDVMAARVTLPAAMPIAQPAQRVSAAPAPLMLPAPAIKLDAAQVALPSAPSMAQVKPAAARESAPASDGSASGNRMPAVPGAEPLGTQNVASVNLDPSATGPLPPGRRAGEFSTAPQTGNSAGAKSGANASVPGLTTRGTGRNSGAVEMAMKPPVFAPAENETSVSYRDIMTHQIGSSLSAPLRAGARTVPFAIEAKFHDRPIYTMVIPSPKLPQYAADWILWFSEKEVPVAGLGAIHAPTPDRKRVPSAMPAYTWGAEADVQIAMVIDESGRIQDAIVSKLPAGFPAQFALADVALWQFKPATRNGVPVAVEAILDVPFRRILSGLKP